MTSVTCIQQANSIIGESPSWDLARRALYWVDIKRPAVFRWEPELGQTGHWPMPKPIGCVAPAKSERLIFADAEGPGFLDLSSGEIVRIASPEEDMPLNRFNDGKIDRAGRFWAGTMDDQCRGPTGSLYRLDANLSIHRMVTGFICSNGMGWSPDNQIMYFTDSMVRTIWAYDYELSTGELGARRVFAQLSDGDGMPDGLTVDSEGGVWVAIWDGWRVVRYLPSGAIDKEIPLPIQRPTSCTFGGADLKTLFVTSACLDLSWQSLRAGSLAGALFAIRTEVVGLPETDFAG